MKGLLKNSLLCETAVVLVCATDKLHVNHSSLGKVRESRIHILRGLLG
jgi:hypothetical protein